MAGFSKIEWTTATWNPVAGCSIVSPGCTNCYAMKMAYRIEMANAEAAAKRQPERGPQYNGSTKRVNGQAVWTGRVAFSEKALLNPLDRKKPTTWFVNSMSDLFHESVPDEWIDKVFAVMALTPQHTYQVLTKRSARMRQWFSADRANSVGLAMLTVVDRIPHGHRRVPWPLPNVWLGVSTERQQEYDLRAPDLRETPAAVRFFSMEPLIGPITAPWLGDWVIVGGENGDRPMHPDHARSLRDQCAAAGVPFFFKQWGTNIPDEEREGRYRRVPKRNAGRLLDGVEHNAMPEAR